MNAALRWFAAAPVDLILLLGDCVQFGNPADLEHVFARLATGATAPLATVSGNHDLRLGDGFAESAHEHGIRLLNEHPVELGGVEVTGVAVARGPKPPQYVGQAATRTSADGLVVVASHFPVLSEASRVAAAGLPYAGDLVNRADLEGSLRSDRRPKVVLCGHVHARCSTHDGPLLQLMVGAVIEPPFDATVVEIEGSSVRKAARRLGEVAVTDPVFSADEERWQQVDGRWVAEAPAG